MQKVYPQLYGSKSSGTKSQVSALMAQEGMRVPGEAPPQEAANGPASGVIGGENATPAETVADDIPMDVPEGSFIINAAAAEVAGYGDIKTMIMDAIGVARRLGVEISTGDEQVGDEEAVDLLVSKGEVYIEPTLAKIIGYDVLEKINNRGKREVARRQKEAEAKQQQEPQQAPQPQMAQDGGFVKKKFADGGESSFSPAVVDPITASKEERISEGKRFANEGFRSTDRPSLLRRRHPSNSYLTSYLNFSKINDDVIFPLMSLYMEQPDKPISDMFSFGDRNVRSGVEPPYGQPVRRGSRRGTYSVDEDVVKLIADPVASDFTNVDPKFMTYLGDPSISRPFQTRLDEDITAAHEMLHGSLSRPIGFLEDEISQKEGYSDLRTRVEHRIINYLMPKSVLDNKKVWIDAYGENEYKHQLANESFNILLKLTSDREGKRGKELFNDPKVKELQNVLFKNPEDKFSLLRPSTEELEGILNKFLKMYEDTYKGGRSDVDNFIKAVDFEKVREMTGTEQSKRTVLDSKQRTQTDPDVDDAAEKIKDIITNKKNSGGFVKKKFADGGETGQEFPDYIKKYFMPEIDYHLETIRSKTVARNQYGQPTTAYTSGVRRGDKIYEIPTYDRKGGILSRAEVEASLDSYIEKYGDFGIPQSEYNTLMREKEAYKQELYSKDNRFKVPEDAITQKIVLPEEEQQDSGGFVPKK